MNKIKRPNSHAIFETIFMVTLIVLLQGCSISKTLDNPTYKDLSILKKGSERARIIAEIGAPVATIEEYGDTVDIFKFKQGSHTTTKIIKGVGYTVLALSTFGISEAVMWPTETAVGAGSDIELKVVYDKKYVVKQVKIYRDDRWIKLSELNQTEESTKN
jgi:hypothetical protein